MILALDTSTDTTSIALYKLNAGRGRLAWAVYRTKGTRWQRLTPYANSTPREMAEGVAQVESNVGTLFCGDISQETASVLKEVLGKSVSIAPAAAAVRRAGYLAELALQKANQGENDDLATLQPIYLQPQATVEVK